MELLIKHSFYINAIHYFFEKVTINFKKQYIEKINLIKTYANYT